jgi:hypothetical protein
MKTPSCGDLTDTRRQQHNSDLWDADHQRTAVNSMGRGLACDITVRAAFIDVPTDTGRIVHGEIPPPCNSNRLDVNKPNAAHRIKRSPGVDLIRKPHSDANSDLTK